MKKRVRVYKAADGQGQYLNPTAQFLKKAQMGMQQQEEETTADPQQIIGQVASLVAPPPYGKGQNPKEVYQLLVDTYGPETASQLMNAAAAYVEQIVQQQEGQQQQEEQPAEEYTDLSDQEELFRQEQERQEEEYNNQVATEDEEDFNDMMMETPSYFSPVDEEMKLGGEQKKFVKHAMKLAKKALGDAGKQQQGGKADSTDILNGRQQKTTDFLSTIQNQATLSTLQKQAENMASTLVKPQPTFQQMGGFTGGDLYRFVYGGDDASIPSLTQAKYGLQQFQGEDQSQTGEQLVTITDITGATKQVTSEEADQWNKLVASNPNTSLAKTPFASESTEDREDNVATYQELQAAGEPVGNYVEGIDYSKYPTKQQSGTTTYNPQFSPRTSSSIFDALIPGNGIWNKTYTMTGTNLGGLDPKKLMGQGFQMDKKRLGFGHKQYTFTPIGSNTVTADNKNQNKDRMGYFDKDQYGNSRAYYDRQIAKQDIGNAFNNAGENLKGFMSKIFTRPEKAPKAQVGINTNMANNQMQDIPELKPKTAKEVWSSVEPQLRKEWGLERKDDERIPGTPTLTIDEKRQINGENLLNMVNPALRGITKGINSFNNRDIESRFADNLTADNLYTATDNQFRGNYDPNSGLFRQNEMGQLEQSREGGERRKTGQQNNWGLGIYPTAMGGADIDQYMGKKPPEVADSLKAVPRDEANLEAEGGETAFGDINGDGFPEHMKIVGPRHTKGGVPLNLPDDTFIFSDTRSMKIADPKILKMFNKPVKKGGYTPAELAKQYDINKYRTILEDPESDVIDRKTAEQMIKNFNIKLGALALAQESKKGFPQGIPVVSRAYMDMMGLKDEDIIPQEEQQQDPAMMQQGMESGQEPAEASPEEMAMMQQTGEMGMPPVDQMAMGQEDMSGAPMAAYGMQMGGYDLPYGQEGYITPGRFNSPITPEDFADMQFKSMMTNGAQYFYADDNVVPFQGEDAHLPSYFPPHLLNKHGEPKMGARVTNMPKTRGEGVTSGESQMGYNIGDPFYGSSRNFKDTLYDFTHPGEFKKRKQYGIYNDVDHYNTGVNDFAYGGSLDKYQSRGEVNYNVKDESIRTNPVIDEKGYMFLDPSEDFIYTDENIGPQTRSTGYKVDPESGFYYNPTTGKKPGAAGLEDFYRRHKFFIDKYEGRYGSGKAAWMKEQVEAKGKENPAMKYVVDNLNALHRQLTGEDMVDVNQRGAYIPGVELFNLPGIERKPKEKDETTVEETEEEETTDQPIDQEETIDIPIDRKAPWWLQDQLKLAGALGDLNSINKYYDWIPKFNPEIPKVAYLDPTRAISSTSEQAKILGDSMAQFSPSAQLAAGRMSGLQGQLAKNASDIANQYDTANVQIANQFAGAQADARNKAQIYNQGLTKKLYDSNTIMNQQFDNSERALRNNVLNQYINGITDAMKTDAMNQMYPQFNVDPATGGRMHMTGVEKGFRPESSATLDELYMKYFRATKDSDAAKKFAMLEYNNQNSNTSNDLYPAEAMMSLYGNMKKGGTFTFGPGMLPPLIL